MKSGGLRGTFMSINTNVRAGDKTPNYVFHPPFFIAFVIGRNSLIFNVFKVFSDIELQI